MFFGEFLLDKGVISKQQLVDCVIAQLNTSPSLLSILKNNLDVSDDVLVKLVKEQVNGQQSLLEVEKRLNLIGAEKMNRAMEILQEKRTAFGEVLVAKEYLESSALLGYLEEYRSASQRTIVITDTNRDSTESQETNTTEQVEDDSGSDISALALESLEEQVRKGEIDASILEELKKEMGVDQKKSENQASGVTLVLESGKIEDAFVDEIKEELLTKKVVQLGADIKSLTKIHNSKNLDQLTEIKKSIVDRIHRIKSVARLSGALTLAKVVGEIEDRLTDSSFDKFDLVYRLFEMVLVLKLSIESKQSEEIFFSDQGNMKKLETILTDLAS